MNIETITITGANLPATGGFTPFFSGRIAAAPISEDNPPAMIHGFMVTVRHEAYAFMLDVAVPVTGFAHTIKLLAAMMDVLDVWKLGDVKLVLPGETIDFNRLLHVESRTAQAAAMYPALRKASADITFLGQEHRVTEAKMIEWAERVEWPVDADGWGIDGQYALHKNGIIFFAGNIPFLDWSTIASPYELFRYDSMYAKEILDNCAYDGLHIWHKGPYGWLPHDRADFEQYLVHTEGLSKEVKPDGYSQTGSIMSRILFERRVVSAIDYLYLPEGVVTLDGKQYLNRTQAKVAEMAPPFMDTSEGWNGFMSRRPATGKYLHRLLQADQYWQLECFLAWLKHFYVGAHDCKPTVGQVLVLKQKHYGEGLHIAEAIIQGLCGKESAKIEHLAVTGQDVNRLGIPHGRIIAAARDVASLLELRDYPVWGGRHVIVVDCDNETESLAPEMDKELENLVMYIDVNKMLESVPDMDADDLPFLARFLYDWDPQHTVDSNPDKRLYATTFRNDNAIRRVVGPGKDMLVPVLEKFIQMYAELHPKEIWWEGTAKSLANELTGFDREAAMALIKSSTGLGHLLSRLKKDNFNLTSYQCNSTRRRMWRIGFDLHKAPNYYMLNQSCTNDAEKQSEWMKLRRAGKLDKKELYKRDAR